MSIRFLRLKRIKGKNFVGDIKKAIVFPFNKETMHIASAEDLTSFEICGYYDFNISLNNYRFVDEIIKNGRHVQIQPFHKIDWNDTFDTVICGHCLDYDRLTHKNTLIEVKKMCQKYSKNIYFFDYLTDTSDDNCYFPHVTKRMMKSDNCINSKLYSINKPILAIMGTSSVQGKYNLQLSLRRNFIQRGYQVSNIGSEPSGYLFGFDAVIPFGYNSHVKLSSCDFIHYLNDAVKQAEMSLADIIIVGSQSGTAPIINNNFEYLYIRQHELLLGTNPDGVILCVNYFDSGDHICKTIHLIEGLISGKVIALYVSALEMPKPGVSIRNQRKKISATEMNQYLKFIESKTALPAYSMLDSIDELTEQIINYFSNS